MNKLRCVLCGAEETDVGIWHSWHDSDCPNRARPLSVTCRCDGYVCPEHCPTCALLKPGEET